jgi:GlcNAc-PI de-N-acetylase
VVTRPGARRAAPNRIDRPGTAEGAWVSWLGSRHLPVADLGAWSSAVIVAAHPDDEILGAGGTMALLAAAGTRLRLVAVTDGEASHPGTLLAVHWRHHVADYPRSGDDVHRVLAARPGLARLVRHTEPDFLAEIYIRTDGAPVSVAQATGLA